MFAPTHEALPVSPLALEWGIASGIAYLNHGSFGACPKVVLAHQEAQRGLMEAQLVQYLGARLEGLFDGVRAFLGQFLHCEADDLALVPNATAGVNTVLRSFRFTPGDELLTTTHEYNACRNALEYTAAMWGATVTVAELPFPVASEEDLLAALLRAVTPRTRLALIDHVTSPTGLILPVQAFAGALRERGIPLLVDGAHAPGMIDLDIPGTGASYYTGNCHKWMCAPKGAGFLWVRRDLHGGIRPLCISHGANSPRQDRSRFRLEFDWTGTGDPTPWLCVPVAVEALRAMVGGDFGNVRRRNHEMALTGRALVGAGLGLTPPCPGAMIGSMAAMPLPASVLESPVLAGYQAPAGSPFHPLQDFLWSEFQIEVPVIPWPALKMTLLRISAQLYNSANQYARLAEVLAYLRGARL